MESAAENLSVLARRTESFSPSKHNLQLSYRPPLNISPCSLFASGRPSVPQAGSELETSTSSLSSPSDPTSDPTSSQPHAAGSPNAPLFSPEPQSSKQPTSSGFSPLVSAPASDILTPTMVSASNQCIYVLPLSPLANSGQPLIHTSHDLILPPASAFSSSTYPIFTTVECTWQYILDMVINPSPLWSSYAPGSLGDYADVKSIWQAWDEGTYIKDVGHKPALRLIDARWGNLESQETHKRKFPSWRPRNDNKVCSVCFYFFYSQRKFYDFILGSQNMVEFLFFYSPH